MKSKEMMTFIPGVACMAIIFFIGLSGMGLRSGAAEVDYSDAVVRLEKVVQEEMQSKGISGIALALVDDQQILHAAGFGVAKKDSIFRCGSISKLFNAVAVMQLVQDGRLDLDTPVRRYDRGLTLVSPFEAAAPITLRQLLCHRSGMIRESPVGGYLDDSEPGLSETIASVPSCVLVNPPNTKTRYSNVAPSIAGWVVSSVAGMAYERYQQEHILGPLGMTHSSFLLKGVKRNRIVVSYMRVADGRGGFKRRKAPLFDLGTIPAGNLFTTVEDLARFVSMLAAEGRAPDGLILSPGSLSQMTTPQLVESDTGFGIGFFVGKLGARKTIGHMGAVYGYTSSILFLPGERLGVVLLCNEDIASGPVKKLVNLAMALLLEAKLGERPPALPVPITLESAELAAFAGDYESESYWAHLKVVDGQLRSNISGQSVVLTPVGPLSFLADGRLENNSPLKFVRDDKGQVTRFTLGQTFARVTDPSAVPQAWKRYLGSYGPSFIPLVISERHGHLYAMTENMVDYRLRPVNRHVFAMPPGLYSDEHLVFLTNSRGKPHAVDLANMVLKRR